MYKILYIVSTLQWTGPTNQLLNLIKHLNKEKFQAVILTLSPEPEHSLLKRFVDLNVEVSSLGLTRIQSIFLAKSKLRKSIGSLRPDLIHTQGIRADNLVRRLDFKIPTITTIRTLPGKDYKSRYGKILGSIMARNHYNAIKNLDGVFACSRNLSNRFLQKKGISIDYIQNGVEKQFFKKAPDTQKRNLRQKFGYSSDSKLFLYTGTLDALKDIGTLVTAFNNLTKRSNLILLIVGDGPEKSKLQKSAHGNDNINFVNRTSNVLEYYQCADFYISASLFEGLPNSVLEAMACGLPVILSNIDSHREIVNVFDNYSYLFETKNSDQLNRRIEEIIDKDYKELSIKMLNIVEANFSAEIMSKKYQDMYLKK